jgi:hypothetical protein
MKKPTKVQAPEGCDEYLTAGKIYDVVGYWENQSKKLDGFQIIDDEGDRLDCVATGCAFLNGGDWIIVETE